ncbi:MAG: YqgE/AlgH family protein [Verrucomicrobiota bacterium]
MPKEPSNPKKSATLDGNLLLADPSLRDGCFDRSVVLLLEHGKEDGAFGLVLNHPIGQVVGDFLTDDEFAPLRKIAVHSGGPVSAEQMTFCSLWWSPKRGLRYRSRISSEDAVKQSRMPGRIVRAFIGYSGWTPGQLEKEMKANAWVTIRPGPELFGQPHDRALWTNVMAGISPFHRILSLAPDHPFLN